MKDWTIFHFVRDSFDDGTRWEDGYEQMSWVYLAVNCFKEKISHLDDCIPSLIRRFNAFELSHENSLTKQIYCVIKVKTKEEK